MTELLTIAEAAKALGHCPSWLRRKIRARRIPVYRPLGGHPRVKLDDLEKAIAESCVAPKQGRARKPRGRSTAVLEGLKESAREVTA